LERGLRAIALAVTLTAAALAVFAYLDAVGHRGPRVLIHSDLGVVEWDQSRPVCERLAKHLGVELIVVRRKSGDLMDRWESRWESSKRRYAALETVTLVLPWSTPSMRFCTSELKTHLIGAELRRRYRGQAVLNVTGVRREESAARAKGAIATRESDGRAISWRPISDWTQADVFAYIAANGLPVHQAYTELGMSRVSCRFCIMSKQADLLAAAAAEESHGLYRRMVALETASTFAFQGSRWLGDIAPQLLSESARAAFGLAKFKAARRGALEKRLSREMMYVKGWPTRMLTDAEAARLAGVRSEVSGLLGIKASYLDVSSIHGRYAELMAANEHRQAA
jgi:3'-phosphoadenosine 5'-phosphosulfate sulfotransferase (PAPS reductase)/FAD synthetase